MAWIKLQSRLEMPSDGRGEVCRPAYRRQRTSAMHSSHEAVIGAFASADGLLCVSMRATPNRTEYKKKTSHELHQLHEETIKMLTN